MAIRIRQEVCGDRAAVYGLVEAAFADVQESDHREQFLVERLRGADSFVPPEFCMVIELLPHAVDKLHGLVRYPAVFFE